MPMGPIGIAAAIPKRNPDRISTVEDLALAAGDDLEGRGLHDVGLDRALVDGLDYRGGILLRELRGESDGDADLFHHLRNGAALGRHGQLDPLRRELPGPAELQDIKAGAGGDRREKIIEGRGRGPPASLVDRLVRLDEKSL